ncbi:MAG: TonB-dependent receptor [Bacteroidales bacterium]|nr:TonB-dependent receptor [Bacteroidales bacterium]
MKTKYISIVLALLLSISAFAQHNEEVTIEGTYRPKVNKVDKIVLQPETPEQKFEMPNTETHLMDIDRRFPLDLEKLSAQSYSGKNARMPESTKNFLMAGFGTRISPVFLYKHNSNLTKNLGLGVGIKHYSSWLDIKDYAPSSFMNNAFEIGLTSSKYKNVQLEGDVYYKNDMVHYYGVNLLNHPLTDEQIELCCPKQIYNTIGGHFGMAPATTRTGEVNHHLSVDYHYTFDKTYAREHSVETEYGLGYTQSWWGNKSHPQKIGMDLGFQWEHFASNHVEYFLPVINQWSLYLIKVNPFFEMGDEFYKLHLGVRLDGVNRVQNGDQFLAVCPDVSGSLFVLDKKLEFYAGLNGGRKLTTYSNLITENPFVGRKLSMLAQNVKLGFDGGVRTNIGEVVDLHLGVRYRHTDNDPFFVHDRSVPEWQGFPNKYDVVYDETQLVSVLADMRVKLRDGFTVDMGFAYNNYKMTNEDCPWHRPKMEGKLKLTYDVNDKLAFNTTFLYQGGRYAKDWNNGPYWMTKYPPQYDVVKLKDVYDLSLGADYRFNDQLSVFAKLDNVLNQKYQLYYGYPVEGIQFFAGLKMRF